MPINNDDCLMLQFYSKNKTKIAANSQGNISIELSFHGSYSAYKVLPVGYTSIIHNKKIKKRNIRLTHTGTLKAVVTEALTIFLFKGRMFAIKSLSPFYRSL